MPFAVPVTLKTAVNAICSLYVSREEMITAYCNILNDKRFERISKKKSRLLITKPKHLVAVMSVCIHTDIVLLFII